MAPTPATELKALEPSLRLAADAPPQRDGMVNTLRELRQSKSRTPDSIYHTWHGFMRAYVGLILLAAAGLKAYHLATGPAFDSFHTPRSLLIAVVEGECFMGLWVFSGTFARASWKASLGCFGIFACMSLYKLLTGESNCGCFGRIEVHPSYSLSLNLAVLASLVRWRPKMAGHRISRRHPSAWRVAVVGTVWIIVGVPVAWVAATFEAGTVTASGMVVGPSDLVILEPRDWVGQPFPLLEHTDIGDRLAKGEWIVLLYHHDCQKCQQVLPSYERLANDLERASSNRHVALLDVPPFAESRRPDAAEAVSATINGRLQNTRKWFVETPVVLFLKESIVVRVDSPSTAAP